MNEPTSKPSRPIVVGFGSVPGGTGCTTLAIHAATYAARRGLHTLAISIDPSADMLRRMGVDQLFIDACWIKEDRLTLAFVPPPFFFDVVEYLPNLRLGGEVANPDIIFLDLGPGIVQSGTVRADFWVVPIQDTRSFESIKSQTYPQGRRRTFFVLSQVPYGDKKRFLSSVCSLVNDLPDGKAEMIFADIPNSGLILRTAVECKTIWELSSSSESTAHIDCFCKELLSLVEQDRTKVQSAAQEIARAFEICARDGNTPSSPGPLPSDDVQDETLKAAQAGVETNPPTQDKPNHKQQKLNRRITHGFEREIERLFGTGVVPKASRRKKRA